MKKTIALFLFLALFLLLSSPALALPTKPLNPCPSGQVCLENPLPTDNPHILIGRAISAILGLTGSLALLIFIYGGVVWLTSAGNPERIRRGRDALLWAMLGLVVIFSAYACVRLILGIF
jgi:hypothetical protein